MFSDYYTIDETRFNDTKFLLNTAGWASALSLLFPFTRPR